MAHLGLAFDIGADHETGRVAQAEQRQAVGLAELHEAGGLVRSLGVDGAAQVVRVVGKDANGPALDSRQCGDHAGAEVGPQFEHAVRVGQRMDHGAHVVHAQAILGHQMPQRALIGCRPVLHAALEESQVLARGGDGGTLVIDEHVDHSIARQVSGRPDLLWTIDAQAATFDHGRPAHADVGGLRRDDHVGAAQQRGIAGEAAAVHHADKRHLARKRRELAEGVVVQARHHRHVHIARAATAAFCEQHRRQFQPVDDSQQPVLFVVVAPTLCAGQHAVVVGQYRAT